jgi:hypothetical protein
MKLLLQGEAMLPQIFALIASSGELSPALANRIVPLVKLVVAVQQDLAVAIATLWAITERLLQGAGSRPDYRCEFPDY